MSGESRPAQEFALRVHGADAVRVNCGDEMLYDALRRGALEISVRVPRPMDRLAPLCDLLWNALSPRGLSWVGFYLEDSTSPIDAPPTNAGDIDQTSPSPRGELHLSARRDTPACSPIGLQGVCGQSFLEESVRLVEDVALLGSNYIACDPRDASEVVIPIYRHNIRWGVLDADSHRVACFGPGDVAGLCGVLRAAGLLERDLPLRSDRLQRTGQTL